ncbi:HYR domain-containing protein, partial [Oceanihabitans sediminis]
GAPTTADNCGVASVTNDAPATFPLGETTVTWTVTDNAGLTATCTQTVTVNDTTPPTITCPADLVISADTSCEATSVALGTPTIADNCGVASVTNDAPATFPLGETTVTWIVTDNAGLTATCTQTVTVNDTTPPTITCPADMTNIPVDSGTCAAVVNYTAPIGTDNCTGATTTQTTGLPSGSAFPVGTTTNTFVVTDIAGNTTTCSFNITVIDNELPNISCPVNINIDNDPGNCNAVVTWPNPTATDNCTGYTVTSSHSSGDTFPIGTTEVTYTITDASGNTATCSFNVTVEDNENPVITCPSDITIDSDPGNCDAIVTWTAPTATDNCAGFTVTSSHNPGDTFPLGTTTVTYTIIDASNNATNCSFNITVEDNEAPTASNPEDIIVQCLSDVPEPNITVVTDEADNCGSTTVIHIGDSASPSVNDGTIIRTYQIEDSNGNTTNVTQNIFINDTVAPVPDASSLPVIEVQCSVTLTPPTATDTCAGIITGTTATTTYSTQGEFTVIWVFDDGNGNTTEQGQTVIIKDTEAPATPSLPDLVGECSLTLIPPTTTDNCLGEITGTTSLTDLTITTVGTDVINWQFTDAAGNTIIVPQNIEVTDNAPIPELENLPPIVADGCQILDMSFFDTIPTATDGCNGSVITGTLGDDFVFPYSFSGTHSIDWVFTDSNGNVITQSQDITLNPIEVNGGTVTGTFNGSVFSNGIDISSCGEVINVDLNLIDQIGSIVQWEKFAVNDGVWEVVTNTTTNLQATFPVGALESTYYRVLVQTGTCFEYSNQFFIRALPPSDPPTVSSPDEDNKYCLGEQVNLLATSNYTAIQSVIPDSSGDFNQGQLNTQDPDGWLVDGFPNGFTAGGSATKPRNWSAKTCNNQVNGNIEYCSNEGKYAIAYGNYYELDHKGNLVYDGANPTTLETPIMDLTNAVSASLDFDQAYYFAFGDYANIEISTDGGVTYAPLRLMHAVNTAPINWWDAGTAESYVGSTPTEYNFETDNTSIDLSAYLEESEVRIKWSFTGTTDDSAWALDNIFINQEVVVETEIEWTDGIGDPEEPVIVEGETSVGFSFVPDAPGFHQYGGTALINGCRNYDEDGTALVDIYVTYSYAGENVSYLGSDCGKNRIQLNAYDNTKSATENAAKGAFTLPADCVNCDDPGTGDIGTWSLGTVSGNICGDGAFTTNNPTLYPDPKNDPDAIFTAEEGTYRLIWTVDGCSSEIEVKTINCNQIDFDGVDDHVDFKNENFHLDTGNFSIEAWVKPESITGTHTIFSKRDNRNNGGNNFGYDLSINSLGEVSFNVNQSASITSSPYRIDTDRWYHIALTFNTNRYKLYIDGVLIKDSSGNNPRANNLKAFLGATDDKVTNIPIKYFNGWIDEFRVWDLALSEDQIHEMMNQRISPSPLVTGNVQGNTIPLDINGLQWSNLSAYFQMEPENLACGYLVSTSSTIKGKLKNISTDQIRSAPLPYTSAANGTWNDVNIWAHPNVWDSPNSIGVDGTTKIDWNIVRTSHNISSGDKDITLLGLFVDSNELSMQDPSSTLNETNEGQMLWVTRYLNIDGKIDLVGESQLVQKRYKPTQVGESIFDNTSAGYIERDQQGTGNPFNYNYWGSPVAEGNASTNMVTNESTNQYSIGGVLRDGTTTVEIPFNRPISWTANNTAQASNPAQVSTRWLYTYANNTANTYSEWDFVSNTNLINIGLGFTMKGSGADGTEPFSGTTQNYVFVGIPNNGTIKNSIAGANEALIGNPYPSAIDANAFIDDNVHAINGEIYFWEHYFSNNTHVLRDYLGGYATYTKTGGNPAVTPPETVDGVIIAGGNGTKVPERYIPVGQGFFVKANNTGGNIVFKNSQRIGKREAVTGALNDGSLFFRNSESINNASSETSENLIKRVRLAFKSPEGAERYLLLGFTPNNEASDGYDYGYDAINADYFPSDMSFLIDNEKYVIQGTGVFSADKIYPLSIDLAITGTIEVRLTALENFNEAIDVFVYDSLLGTYTRINDDAFQIALDAGSYDNRYFISFQEEETLSIENEVISNIIVNYLNASNEIYINIPMAIDIKQVSLVNMLGQTVKTWNENNAPLSNECKIPVKKIAEGTYIIKIRTSENKLINKKVVVKQN